MSASLRYGENENRFTRIFFFFLLELNAWDTNEYHHIIANTLERHVNYFTPCQCE